MLRDQLFQERNSRNRHAPAGLLPLASFRSPWMGGRASPTCNPIEANMTSDPPHEHSPGLARCVGHSRDSGIWRMMRCCIIAAGGPCLGRPDHETRGCRGLRARFRHPIVPVDSRKPMARPWKPGGRLMNDTLSVLNLRRPTPHPELSYWSVCRVEACGGYGPA